MRARTVGVSNSRASSQRQRQRPGVVIVGGGRAGWQMAENLRAADADLPITLVSACAGDRYDKPQLSVGLARGIAADQWIKERAADAARRLHLTLLPHTQAIRICPDTRQLRTTRGNLNYAQLVLARPSCPARRPARRAVLAHQPSGYLFETAPRFGRHAPASADCRRRLDRQRVGQ
ncbi:FAD-dependent oxidoreductase [Roseateles sp. GG27B]